MKMLQVILSQDIDSSSEVSRTIYWIYEAEGGTGKTLFLQWIYHTMDDVVLISGKGADVKHEVAKFVEKNDCCPKIVLVNVVRTCQEYVSYQSLEEVKDMFFLSGKYQGAIVSGPRPIMLVMANDGPNREKMSRDRWCVGRIESDGIRWFDFMPVCLQALCVKRVVIEDSAPTLRPPSREGSAGASHITGVNDECTCLVAQ